MTTRRAVVLGLPAAACATGAPRDATMHRIVPGRAGAIEVLIDGPAGARTVVMLPSLGRGAEDFADLAARVAGAGWRVLRPQPRGIGASAPAPAAQTLADLADDVLAAIDAEQASPCVLMGHAFGNRVARMVGARAPDRIQALVLLAAGGRTAMPPDVLRALQNSFDLSLPEPERLASVATAFFAPGNDPAVWRDGWHPAVAGMQTRALATTPVDTWWGAGDLPILVLQPRQDVVAPPENALRLQQEGGARVRVVFIENAGHALLPEQPDAVAHAVLDYLKTLG